ncbi:MAG: DUF1559 domain-containing protein [Planctomycetia bacterium]|nr:DUF1559 domain-containing protein [Planctomycetia bacterium]
MNVSAVVKPDMLKEIPEGLQPLFKAKTWLATLDLNPKTTLAIMAEFATEEQAEDGLKAAQEGVQMLRGLIGNALTFVEKKVKREPGKPPQGIQEFPEAVGFVLAAAGLKQLDGILGKLPIEVKGNTVRTSLDLDGIIPGGGLALSAAVVTVTTGVSVANADRRPLTPGDYDWTQRERNLSQIARAIEKYHKDKGHYPPPAILDKDGKPLLSWRVAILPYMENVYIEGPFDGGKPINGPAELYSMFKLNEPWDSPHNKKLIDKLPSVYRAAWSVIPYPQSSIGKTTTLAVVGKGAIFDPTKKTVGDGDVRDSLKETLLLLSTEDPTQAVYWTKPADIALTAEGKLPADFDLGKRFAVVYADASAHTLVNGLPEKVFMGILTRAGKEKLDQKQIRPEPIKGQNDFPKEDPELAPPPPAIKE